MNDRNLQISKLVAPRLEAFARTDFVTLPKLERGDRVAVISPSAGLPAIFPHVFDQGLERIRSVFGLIPVEYPTTRKMGASLEDRAQDVMNAFADTSIKGVITSIGGNDQIKLLKHLDPEVFVRNPKIFLGYSDNTNLALYLWQLGIPSFYGGAVMCQFGLSGGMQSTTVEGLERAFFKQGRFELRPCDYFTDRYYDWSDPAALSRPAITFPSDGWYWDGTRSAEGILWGGCLEIIDWQLSVSAWLPSPERLKGCILCLETSEEMPSADSVGRTLVSLGERGYLENFAGLLLARPKTWEFNHQLSASEGEEYRKKQREVVLREFRNYNRTAPIIMNVEFGHADPQLILPLGHRVEINAESRKLYAQY